MTIAVIGDIHGCLYELKSLISKIPYDVEELIFVGDLIDKGPHSLSVLKYVRELEKQRKVTIVKGNHEYTHMRFWNYLEKGHIDKAMAMKRSDELLDLMEKAGKDLRCWLQKKVVPYVMQPTLNIVVVHGGLTKRITELFEDPQKLTRKNKKRIERSLFVRYVTNQGILIKLGEDGPEDSFWADVYDGRFGHVYFGHEAWCSEKPQKFSYATGVDLGCVYGGHLCALLTDGSNETIITVPARERYYIPDASLKFYHN